MEYAGALFFYMVYVSTGEKQQNACTGWRRAIYDIMHGCKKTVQIHSDSSTRRKQHALSDPKSRRRGWCRSGPSVNRTIPFSPLALLPQRTRGRQWTASRLTLHRMLHVPRSGSGHSRFRHGKKAQMKRCLKKKVNKRTERGATAQDGHLV
ncbi:hypothetical protein BC830DRAFT_879902 [Chytriomyces sp. MP71]|nr:hypothetical protein BC830DRAFT_879902 [Chytriomyces sp. MP71]